MRTEPDARDAGRPRQAATRAPARSPLLEAVVATVAPEFPPLAAEERAAVVADVADFVAFEIAAMPGFLRVPYRAALAGFDALAVLTGGRRFAALSEARRARHLARFDAAPLAAARDFAKLVRSTSLLAWYDHPRVRERLDAGRAAAG
jgi:hypothetical protein